MSSQPNSKPSVDSTISLLSFTVDLELALTVYIRFSNSAIFLMVSLHTQYDQIEQLLPKLQLQINTYAVMILSSVLDSITTEMGRNFSSTGKRISALSLFNKEGFP